MLFWKLLYFHNTSVDNLWHTFQLPLGKILAQGKVHLIWQGGGGEGGDEDIETRSLKF